MTVRNLVLSVVVIAAISTLAFAEVGVVGHDETGYSQIIVMGTPIGPDPHAERSSRLDPELSPNPDSGASGIRGPGFAAQGNPMSPIPHRKCWASLIGLQPTFALNSGGDANGDGEPSFGFGDPSGGPVPPTFVWARQVAPGNHDPVYAQFVGGAWTAPVVISSDAGDDLDPRWWRDATGVIHAVWWRHGANGGNDIVLYARRNAGALFFASEESVSLPGESARTPSLAVQPDGEVLVGYETTGLDGLKRVTVASKSTLTSAFQPVVLASTPFPDATTPEAEQGAGHVWTTWIDSPTRIGYCELVNGIWSAPTYEVYSNPENVGRARMQIQSTILSH